jgi:hypothetical protein
MEYTLERARRYVGKRVIVSLRHIHSDGSHTYTGFWGIVEFARPDCLILKIEGGSDLSHWAIPPDLEAFQPAQQESYELQVTGQVVTDVDYEMYWSVADDPAAFE